MDAVLEPLKVPSLKDACVRKLEGLILSGEIRIGEKLPSERKLADMLGISRPVVHEALVDLAVKGLVEIVPRKGVYINDFRTTGSCALLSSLLAYHEGGLDGPFSHSLIAMRMLMEVETARLAAANRTDAQIRQLRELLAQELDADAGDSETLTELDFSFHLSVSIASGNLMYPLIMNSFKAVYTNLTRQFFTKHKHSPIVGEVYAFHSRLVDAIASCDSESAGQVMAEMLQHGAEHLL